MEYRREVDGLRALAVLPVIFFHAGFNTFSGGFVGVDVFFVISGYLITSIILGEQHNGSFTLLGFYERRARRILPALFCMILVCWLFAWFWLLPSDLKELSESVVAVVAFVSNIYFWTNSGYFETATELKPLLHTWSLAVEEQYYVIFPLFLMAAWRRLGVRRIVGILVLVAAASLTLAQWASVKSPDAGFYLLPTRAWELLMGALAAFHLFRRAPADHGRVLCQLGSATGLLLIVVSVFALDRHTPFPSVYALLPTAGATLVIVFATAKTAAGRLLGSRPAVGIGLISYSAYLWHQPMFALAKHRLDTPPSELLMATLACATLVLAYASWRFVETPFRSRRSFSRTEILRFGLAGSLGFLALGATGSASTGFAFRFDAADRGLATLNKREAGHYVEERFNARQMLPFQAADSRRKVVIIGDSFAQDVVNAVNESRLGERLQVATRHISHRCGNLFLPRKMFAERIAENDRARCGAEGLYEDDALRRLMQTADEIWFASRWQPWQALLVPASVTGAIAAFGKPIRVFGTKEIGSMNIKNLLAVPVPRRWALVGDVSAETLAINEQLKRSLPGPVFVDLQTLLCGPGTLQCPLFEGSGQLISHDGRHLTPVGARLVGTRLAAILQVAELQRGSASKGTAN